MHPGRAFVWRRSAVAVTAIVGVLGGFAPDDRTGIKASQAAAPQTEAPACTSTVQNDVATPMRDGTILRSNVYTPDGAGPFPILLVRTPYNKDRPFNSAYGAPDVWAGRCYILMGDSTPQRSTDFYNQAIAKFYDLGTTYPEGEKTPAALWEQGQLFLELKDEPDARIVFSRLIRDYPGSPEAARARQKLADLQQ